MPVSWIPLERKVKGPRKHLIKAIQEQLKACRCLCCRVGVGIDEESIKKQPGKRHWDWGSKQKRCEVCGWEHCLLLQHMPESLCAPRCLLAVGGEGRSPCWEMSGSPTVLISHQWGISLVWDLAHPRASSFPEHPVPLASLLGNGCPAVVLSSPGLLCPLLGPRQAGRRRRLAGQRQG